MVILSSPEFWLKSLFGVLSLPLLIWDAKKFYLPPWFLGIVFLATAAALQLWLPHHAFERALFMAGIFLGGSLLWRLMEDRVGFGDVIFASLLALVMDPPEWYFVLILSCLLAMMVFGYFYWKGYDIMNLQLPFVSLMILSYLTVWWT